MTADSLAWLAPPDGDPFSIDAATEREWCRLLLPAMRAFARRRLRSASVDDFVHDALVLFVEALRSGRIRERDRVAAFALGICRNLARDRARTDERRRELIERFPFEPELVVETSTTVRREHLEDCYSQLVDRARRVMRMTFCDDATDGEIAEALAISAANVRVIRHRTLAQLRTCLEQPLSWTKA